MKRRLINLKIPGILLVLILAGCSEQQADLTGEQLLSSNKEALLTLKSGVPDWLKDSYIIAFNDNVGDVDAEVGQVEKSLGVKANFIYKFAIKGFAAKLPEAALNGLKNNPHVKYIEQDQVYTINATQASPTWGLNRIDQRSLPLDNYYTYNQDGTAVNAYIIDTGILQSHTDFGGRAVPGYDAIILNGTAIDDNGHGTHVAGTVGGAQYGVAKNVHLIAVKVLDKSGSGTSSTVIAGINWAINHHEVSVPAVANMSLGGGASQSLDDAVRSAVADGIVMCVAAGNSGADASGYSPARVAEAITVGATSSTDAFASFSNYGSIVDILAPGVSITSDYYTSNTAAAVMSGTSMATPHVTGVAALYKQVNPSATPAQVSDALKTLATPGVIGSLPTGTPNLLLYSLIDGTPPPPPSPPAAPSLSSPATGSTGVTVNPTLTWNSSANATSYEVSVATDINFVSTVFNRTGITSTSVPVSGLANNTLYYWRVRATNSGGTGAWSDAWNFTTTGGALPQAPTLVSPANGATGVKVPVKFLWNASAGATSYKIAVSLSQDLSNPVATKTMTGTSATISGLSKNTYYWGVQAVNAAGSSNWSISRYFTTR